MAKKKTEPVDEYDQVPERRSDTIRETVESIVIAFVLAFLFRTFEAEAFVIPTGSMAPTLFGRHKDIECEKCGLHFHVGASEELNEDESLKAPTERVRFARCPNCRFDNNCLDLPVFKGDRILVNKFPFEFGDPQRWDVVVFKWPEEPTTNYIKRLVGLPGEHVKIFHGDVYARDPQTGEVQILRKDDPNKQRSLQILVYDNNHPERELHAAGWPLRWGGMQHDPDLDSFGNWKRIENGWQSVDGTHGFQIGAADNAGTPQWLRYQHIVPAPSDWRALSEGRPIEPPQPTRVLDFCAYNEDHERYTPPSLWVGDLMLEFTAEVAELQAGAQLTIELVEGLRWYRCHLDPHTGTAQLAFVDRVMNRDPSAAVDRDAEYLVGEAETPLKGPGSYSICLANTDDRLSLWINNELVEFPEGGTYHAPALLEETQEDRAPAGIAAASMSLTVNDLRIYRDIYYHSQLYNPKMEYDITAPLFYDHSDLMDPDGWFQLADDEFLMLGDNSPRSRDSRIWTNQRGAEHRHAVPRSALVGKAFYIYWPHGVPFLKNGQGYPITYHYDAQGKKTDYPNIRFPFYPQVSRMRRIR